jgi:hypothetical protein
MWQRHILIKRSFATKIFNFSLRLSERIERLRLQAKMASRRLTQEQRNKIKEFLSTLPPAQIDVVVFIGTEDGMPFSYDLIEAINSGGWKAKHSGQTTIGGEIRGLAILVKDLKKAPKAARLLQQALRIAGLEAHGMSDPPMADNAVVLFIAPKVL